MVVEDRGLPYHFVAYLSVKPTSRLEILVLLAGLDQTVATRARAFFKLLFVLFLCGFFLSFHVCFLFPVAFSFFSLSFSCSPAFCGFRIFVYLVFTHFVQSVLILFPLHIVSDLLRPQTREFERGLNRDGHAGRER